jgi:DNA processing protein
MAEARVLNPQERLDWLRLWRSDSVGPITFFRLLQQYGSAAAALAALPELAKRGGRTDFRVATRAEAEAELARLTAHGTRLVAWGEDDYPALLAEIEDAPPLLSMHGDPALLRRRTIAMVGARNASAAGQRFARELAWDLARAGFLVVSGLARGIDAAAHGGALETGTAAVIAGGIDVVYPEENRRLHDDIATRGLLIAEMKIGTVPQARHFPRRNRIISGMAEAVIVVEAALKSGSLITARRAAEQGREVLAVPGSPLDPRCRGTNDLIKTGAALIENAEDVIAALPNRAPTLREDRRHFAGRAAAEPDRDTLDQARARLVEQLGPTPAPLDDLIRNTGLSPGLVATILLELELADRVVRLPGNRVALGREPI